MSEWERKKNFGMEITAAKIHQFLFSIRRKKERSNLIDAQYRFLKKRYEHEFKWRPNRKIEEAIAIKIFGENKF